MLHQSDTGVVVVDTEVTSILGGLGLASAVQGEGEDGEAREG